MTSPLNDRIATMTDFERRSALSFLAGFNPFVLGIALDEMDRQRAHLAARAAARAEATTEPTTFYELIQQAQREGDIAELHRLQKLRTLGVGGQMDTDDASEIPARYLDPSKFDDQGNYYPITTTSTDTDQDRAEQSALTAENHDIEHCATCGYDLGTHHPTCTIDTTPANTCCDGHGHEGTQR